MSENTTIVTEEEKEKWYFIIDSTDDIKEIKMVLKELIGVLRKTYLQY